MTRQLQFQCSSTNGGAVLSVSTNHAPLQQLLEQYFEPTDAPQPGARILHTALNWHDAPAPFDVLPGRFPMRLEHVSENDTVVDVYVDGADDAENLAFQLGVLTPLRQKLLKDGWVSLHASGVHDATHCYLMVGDSGAGKSTFSVELASTGMRYLGDDQAFIRLQNKQIELMYFASRIGMRGNLMRRRAHLAGVSPEVMRADKVRGHAPQEWRMPEGKGGTTLPQKLIFIFPRFERHIGALTLTPCSEGEVVDRLMPELMRRYLFDLEDREMKATLFMAAHALSKYAGAVIVGYNDHMLDGLSQDWFLKQLHQLADFKG